MEKWAEDVFASFSDDEAPAPPYGDRNDGISKNPSIKTAGTNGKANGEANGHANNYNISIELVRTAASLRTQKFDPIKYIVLGYITEGATILAGRPKLGKSWLMLSVSLAVSRGGKCLGDIKCDEGDVLYLALEDNERRLQSRITKLIGYAEEWPARFHYATEWPRANNGGLEKIRNWIASVELPRLVVVDVLAMFRSPRQKDQQPYEADYAAIHELQAIASQTGVAIVIVHHLRKSLAEVDPFEKVSGTNGQLGAADTVLILDRDSSGATLYGRGRDIEEIETAVEFDGCRWRVLGAAADVRRSDERKAILDALADADEPLSPREVADITGNSYDAIRQTLIRMARQGEITKTKRGQYACHNDSHNGSHNQTPHSDMVSKTPCHKSHNVTTDEKNYGDNELGCDNGCDTTEMELSQRQSDSAGCDIVTVVTPPCDDGLDIPVCLRRNQ
jgi:Fe2+ or Zn2+ uptake regulation protein